MKSAVLCLMLAAGLTRAVPAQAPAASMDAPAAPAGRVEAPRETMESLKVSGITVTVSQTVNIEDHGMRIFTVKRDPSKTYSFVKQDGSVMDISHDAVLRVMENESSPAVIAREHFPNGGGGAVSIAECTVAEDKAPAAAPDDKAPAEKSAGEVSYTVKIDPKQMGRYVLSVRDICIYRNAKDQHIQALLYYPHEIHLGDFAKEAVPPK